MTAKPHIEQIFASEYLIDFNGKQAAIRAGYSPTQAGDTARRLLADREIKRLIDEAIEDRKARLSLSADWVVRRLKEEAGFYGTGSSHSARVAALTQLAKHVGLLREVPQSPPVTFIFQDFPPPREVTPVFDPEDGGFSLTVPKR